MNYIFILAVGVACGSTLYVHKNNKPYFKFQVPALPVNIRESELWQKILEEGATIDNIESLIKNLSYISSDSLSIR